MLVDVRGRAAIDRVTVDRTGSSVVPPCAHLGHGSGLGRRGEGRGGEGGGGERGGEGRRGEGRRESCIHVWQPTYVCSLVCVCVCVCVCVHVTLTSYALG